MPVIAAGEKVYEGEYGITAFYGLIQDDKF